MNDLFYATIKMTTGEEVLAEVLVCEENGTRFLMLSNPIVMEETFSTEGGEVKVGETSKKWLQHASDDMLIVYMNNVITISEMDKYAIEYYKKYSLVAKIRSPIKKNMKSTEHSGYLGTIESKRKYLEEMYNKSPDIPD